jgi:5-methylcytosine-specific restriction protein B
MDTNQDTYTQRHVGRDDWNSNPLTPAADQAGAAPSDLKNFKKILEYFRHILRANKKLEPLRDNEPKAGRGYKGDKIRESYADFREYSHSRTMDVSIQTGHALTKKACYVHWTETACNIVAVWANNDSDVVGLQLYNYDTKTEYDPVWDIEVLGLNDGLEPNESIKELFSRYEQMLESTLAAKGAPPVNSAIEKNIILYGPPGTGKTYSAVVYAIAVIEGKPLASVKEENYESVFKRYLKYKESGLIAFTTFHQSFGYEEFIEGIRPTIVSEDNTGSGGDIKYEIHDGVFKTFCDKAGSPLSADAAADLDVGKNPNRVFIIDEINRGNISKIFGELITLIEVSKRVGAREQLHASLPYSGQDFGVPDNVYIIGTMNTADRSIALIDTALRRRFSFVEMQPDAELLRDVTVSSLNMAELLITLNKRIEILLDREHTIGHSYLLPLKDSPTMDNLASIFENKIIPLLQEYFYDDYEKICLVLGDNQKSDDSAGIIVRDTGAKKLFGNANVDFSERYTVNRDALKDPKAYEFLF